MQSPESSESKRIDLSSDITNMASLATQTSLDKAVKDFMDNSEIPDHVKSLAGLLMDILNEKVSDVKKEISGVDSRIQDSKITLGTKLDLQHNDQNRRLTNSGLMKTVILVRTPLAFHDIDFRFICHSCSRTINE